MEWTRAQIVERGLKPTSRQMRSLARAVRDRILSGVADMAWRIAYYTVNLFRQVRTPDESGLRFPAQLEYFDVYGSIRPEVSTLVWPFTGPGEYEGANLASVGMALRFGNPSVETEPDRFLDIPLAAAPTLKEKWVLGYWQRGGVDPDTGLARWPVGDAAESWQRIVQPTWSPHGKSHGGYLPTPQKASTPALTYPNECGEDDDDGAYIVSYAHRWTGLRPDVEIPAHHGTLSWEGGLPVITYAGSCPCWTAYTDTGHVLAIWEGPSSTWVAVATGDSCDVAAVWDIFPNGDWIKGPDEGPGVLQHTDGKHLNRVVHAMASDFRGTPAQRTPDTFDIRSIAFPMEEFLGRQYQLAPARGVLVSDTEISVEYPRVTWAGVPNIPAGDVGRFQNGAGHHECADGFVIAGVFACGEGMANGLTIEVLDGDKVLTVLALAPDDDGKAEDMVWFEVAARRTQLRFRARNLTYLEPGGFVWAECAELLEMKPRYMDAMVVQRVGASGNGKFVDGRGIDTETSREIGQTLLDFGCMSGTWPVDVDPEKANRNAAYDAARRLTNSVLRVLNRHQFEAYEVTGGKSVLYVKRFSVFAPMSERVDLLDGIAPQWEAIGGEGLTVDETYVVWSKSGTGYVMHGGGLYGNGQTFVATSADFEPSGDAQVFVHDGIKSVALRKGWTNEWCCFVEPKGYSWSDSSIWKPEAYSDYWPFCDRCHVYSGTFPRALVRFASYNYTSEVDGVGRIGMNPGAQAALYAPEMPPGYRYLEGANQWQYEVDPELFRASCRVYEPPLLIESVTTDDFERGVVRIQFSGRFHSHPDAPATWDRTPPSWASNGVKPTIVEDLEDEASAGGTGYRTIDNALRSYHVHQANGHWHPPLAYKGDYGQGSAMGILTDQPYGSIYPTMFLVGLPREPWEDGNDTEDLSDTRMTVDELQRIEWMLRSSCEGFVDGVLTADAVCRDNPAGGPYDEGTLYDYSWEALMFEATGDSKWVGSVGSALRPENPEGYGPLPNTLTYVETFNRLAAAVNLLDKARLPAKAVPEYRRVEYSGTVEKTFTAGSGCRYLDNAAAPSAGTFVHDAGWLEIEPHPITGVRTFTPRSWCDAVDGTPESLVSGKYDMETRMSLAAGWEDAIPPALLAHVQGGFGGFVARKREFRGWDRRTSSDCAWTNYDEFGDYECATFSFGSYPAPKVPTNDYMLHDVPGGTVGAEADDEYTILLGEHFYVRVPLVDLA